jgi:hypothetical protein
MTGGFSFLQETVAHHETNVKIFLSPKKGDYIMVCCSSKKCTKKVSKKAPAKKAAKKVAKKKK